jgi:hypothetical protein
VKKEKNEKNRNSIGCIGNSDIHGRVSKTIVNKDLAIEVKELIQGTGNFAMDSTEIMSEFATTTGLNYEHHKMIQYDNGGDPFKSMTGLEMYKSPAFHGGTGAMVEEFFFDITEMQKIETVEIFTMANEGDNQSLVFDTCDQFKGVWGTNAEWKKPCKKNIELSQMFDGGFAVQKKLIFEELVKPCGGKDC